LLSNLAIVQSHLSINLYAKVTFTKSMRKRTFLILAIFFVGVIIPMTTEGKVTLFKPITYPQISQKVMKWTSSSQSKILTTAV